MYFFERTLEDFVSFNQPLPADAGLGLLDEYLEVGKSHLESHAFPSKYAKEVSDLLSATSLLNCTDDGKEDAFSGMDWMAEKIDLNSVFDSLLTEDYSEDSASPEELMAALYSCNFLTTQASPDNLQVTDLIPEVPSLQYSETTPLSPFVEIVPFTVSQEYDPHTADDSFSLELGNEVDISDSSNDDSVSSTNDSVSSTVSAFVLKGTGEECLGSDKESGVCMSPGSDADSGICSSPVSYLESPQQSPSSLGSPCSVRSKPYSCSVEIKSVLSKVKSVGNKPVDKKLKKMEQNKTAATRYRQKKRAEQEALSGECMELEDKNKILKEKADSLAREIKYLKDLIEEVRKAKSKKVKT